MGVGGVYTGRVEEGAQALQPLRDYGPPLVDLFQPTPYNQAQRMADFLWPPGHYAYRKSAYLNRLTDEAIDTIAEFFTRVPSSRTVVVLEHGDGLETGGGCGAPLRVPLLSTTVSRWPRIAPVAAAWRSPPRRTVAD